MAMKQNEYPATKFTKVIKQGPKRRAVLIPYKRLLMLQRRKNSLIEERTLWEDKNKELSDALNAEKLLNASLKKESLYWQRLNHESSVTINTYKVKQLEMAKYLSTCLRDIDSIYPHMVALSKSFTSNKILITNLLNTLPSTENPMEHKVGSMVRGCQIVTKPKVLIERLTLPQTQDQINVDDMSPIEVNPLSPIQEMDEDPVRLKRRSKLGRSWKQQTKENHKKDIVRNQFRKSSVPVSFNKNSSEGIPAVIQQMDENAKEKSSSLSKLESTHVGEGESPQLVMRPHNPMEAKSWVYSNDYPSHFNDRRSSLYKSDSPDDEDTLMVQKQAPNLSTLNTLVMKNQSFNNATRKSASHNTSSDFTAEEPDSTNNVESFINKDLSNTGSKSPCTPPAASTPGISTGYATANNIIEQQLSKSNNRLSVFFPKVSSTSSRFSNSNSNLCDSPEHNLVTYRKRIREPNNEQDSNVDDSVPNMNTINNNKRAKLSSEKKSLPGKNKSKAGRPPKKRLSSRPSNIVEDNNNGEFENKEKNKDDIEESSNKARSTKSKTRLSKKSNTSPKTSIKSKPQPVQDSGGEGRTTRRTRSGICYKEYFK